MQTAAVRKGIRIEQISIAWMVVEAGVALWAGLQAHSIALVAFGADSIIELIAGFVTQRHGSDDARLVSAPALIDRSLPIFAGRQY